MEKGTVLTLNVTGFGASCEGVASHEGYRIFVEGALPGETVLAKLTEVKKSYAKAKTVEVIQQAKFRKEPSCPYFARCGGCHLMHVEEKTQLELKAQRVRDAMQRIGKFDVEVKACMPSEKTLGYRNKIQLPVSESLGKMQMGFYAMGSHDLIDIEECEIHCDRGETVLKTVKGLLKQRKIQPFNGGQEPQLRHVLIRSSIYKQESLVVFVVTKEIVQLRDVAFAISKAIPDVKGVVENIQPEMGNVILGSKSLVLTGRPHLYEEILGYTFKISHEAFFQVNPYQSQRVYAKALELAELHPQSQVLDAYCGVGTLSILASKKARAVYGIESVSEAIQNAKENATLNAVNNCHFYCGKVEEAIDRFSHCDVVLLNPPRKGCEKSVLLSLQRIAPHKIVYISCDPATLARDLAILKEYGYQIGPIYPFDMFPQTMHVESVAVLTKG